jgi:hypothetical protein
MHALDFERRAIDKFYETSDVIHPAIKKEFGETLPHTQIRNLLADRLAAFKKEGSGNYWEYGFSSRYGTTNVDEAFATSASRPVSSEERYVLDRYGNLSSKVGEYLDDSRELARSKTHKSIYSAIAETSQYKAAREGVRDSLLPPKMKAFANIVSKILPSWALAEGTFGLRPLTTPMIGGRGRGPKAALRALEDSVDNARSVSPERFLEDAEKLVAGGDIEALKDVLYHRYGKESSFVGRSDNSFLNRDIRDAKSSSDIMKALKLREEQYAKQSKGVSSASRFINEPRRASFDMTPDSGVGPEDYVTVSHGGGVRHLEEFFGGKTPGYRLEEGGVGIQVSPANKELVGELDELSKMYATRAANASMDTPAVATFRIKAKYLDAATNDYEAGLRPDFIDKVKSLKITPFKDKTTASSLPTSKGLKKLAKKVKDITADDLADSFLKNPSTEAAGGIPFSNRAFAFGEHAAKNPKLEKAFLEFVSRRKEVEAKIIADSKKGIYGSPEEQLMPQAMREAEQAYQIFKKGKPDLPMARKFVEEIKGGRFTTPLSKLMARTKVPKKLKRKMGIELESQGFKEGSLQRGLEALSGSRAFDAVMSRDIKRHMKVPLDNKFRIERDATVGGIGIEYQFGGSGGMRTTEDLQNAFARIRELQSLGAKASEGVITGKTSREVAGMHLHIDKSDLSQRDIEQVFKNYGDIEHLLDELVPETRRGRTNPFTGSVKGKKASDLRGKKHSNIREHEKYGTLEFRQPQSTFDVDEIKGWMSMLNRLVDISKDGQGVETSTLEGLLDSLGFAQDSKTYSRIMKTRDKYNPIELDLNPEDFTMLAGGGLARSRKAFPIFDKMGKGAKRYFTPGSKEVSKEEYEKMSMLREMLTERVSDFSEPSGLPELPKYVSPEKAREYNIPHTRDIVPSTEDSPGIVESFFRGVRKFMESRKSSMGGDAKAVMGVRAAAGMYVDGIPREELPEWAEDSSQLPYQEVLSDTKDQSAQRRKEAEVRAREMGVGTPGGTTRFTESEKLSRKASYKQGTDYTVRDFKELKGMASPYDYMSDETFLDLRKKGVIKHDYESQLMGNTVTSEIPQLKREREKAERVKNELKEGLLEGRTYTPSAGTDINVLGREIRPYKKAYDNAFEAIQKFGITGISMEDAQDLSGPELKELIMDRAKKHFNKQKGYSPYKELNAKDEKEFFGTVGEGGANLINAFDQFNRAQQVMSGLLTRDKSITDTDFNKLAADTLTYDKLRMQTAQERERQADKRRLFMTPKIEQYYKIDPNYTDEIEGQLRSASEKDKASILKDYRAKMELLGKFSAYYYSGAAKDEYEEFRQKVLSGKIKGTDEELATYEDMFKKAAKVSGGLKVGETPAQRDARKLKMMADLLKSREESRGPGVKGVVSSGRSLLPDSNVRPQSRADLYASAFQQGAFTGMSAQEMFKKFLESSKSNASMKQYAHGGPITETGPVFAHKGEFILPAKLAPGGQPEMAKSVPASKVLNQSLTLDVSDAISRLEEVTLKVDTSEKIKVEMPAEGIPVAMPEEPIPVTVDVNDAAATLNASIVDALSTEINVKLEGNAVGGEKINEVATAVGTVKEQLNAVNKDLNDKIQMVTANNETLDIGRVETIVARSVAVLNDRVNRLTTDVSETHSKATQLEHSIGYSISDLDRRLAQTQNLIPLA